MGHHGAVGSGHRGGGGIPALRAAPVRLIPGLVPFLLAAAIGGWDASTALVDPDLPSGGGLFVLAAFATLGAAGYLVTCVGEKSGRGAPGGVLLIAATYVVPVVSHRAGPWSAGVVGVGLLALAWVTQVDIRRHRRLPVQPITWGLRAAALVAGASLVLDVLVALLGGSGARDGGHVSTFAVLVVSVAGCGLVAGVAALAEGVRPPSPSGRHPGAGSAAVPAGPDQDPAQHHDVEAP